MRKKQVTPPECEINESERSNIFEKAFTINPAAIGIARLEDGMIIEVNEAWQQLFGYSREEAVGRSVGSLGLWPNSGERERYVEELREKGSFRNRERTVVKKSGEDFVALNSSEIMKFADTDYVVSTWLDITKRKHAEDALKESKEYLNQVINCIGDPIFAKNRGHQLVLVNNAYCAASGMLREQLLGNAGLETIPQNERNAIWEQEEAVFCSGNESITEEVISDRQGIPHEMMTRKTLLTDQYGNKQIVGVVRDITESKRLENQLRQSQKLEAIGALAGGIAHDFNNLLSVIQGYTELLLKDCESADPRRNDIEQISKAGQRAAALTSQLLAFSRKQILQLQKLDVNAAIAEMSVMLRRLIGENIELIHAADPETGWICADPVQIQQILMNLAINARDAMPEGGKLTIETTNVDVDQEWVRLHPVMKPGSHVMIAISDSGIGMDPATQARIFEPFFTTKEKGRGTGLGLATVYGIVKQSNGYIWVYSEPGKGTTFKLYFPRVKEMLAFSSEEPRKTDGSHKAETILIVEDEESVRALASRILNERGYRVLEASNGMNALRLVKGYNSTIDLVLTDVVMPGISGRVLVSELESIRPGIKSLFFSGYTDNSIVHHGVLDSRVAFLQKPFSAKSLLQKVSEVIGSS